MANINAREVEEGRQVQGEEEEITWSVNTAANGTPTSPTAKTYDVTTNYTDVTSTVMPVGTASVTGTVITLPELKLLTQGHLYMVQVKYTIGANILEDYFYVQAQR
jgi:hypothetical protein